MALDEEKFKVQREADARKLLEAVLQRLDWRVGPSLVTPLHYLAYYLCADAQAGAATASAASSGIN